MTEVETTLADILNDDALTSERITVALRDKLRAACRAILDEVAELSEPEAFAAFELRVAGAVTEAFSELGLGLGWTTAVVWRPGHLGVDLVIGHEEDADPDPRFVFEFVPDAESLPDRIRALMRATFRAPDGRRWRVVRSKNEILTLTELGRPLADPASIQYRVEHFPPADWIVEQPKQSDDALAELRHACGRQAELAAHIAELAELADAHDPDALDRLFNALGDLTMIASLCTQAATRVEAFREVGQ